jgi:RHS repeat-associated protein
MFTAPQSTANVVFTYGNGNSWTTVPLSSQHASANGFDPGTDVQSFSVLATFQGDGNYNPASASSSFTISQATPTISISNPPSSVQYGGSLLVSYSYSGNGSPTETVSSSPSNVCTVSGNTVSFKGLGTCILQASATATTDYIAVQGSPQNISVVQGTPTISISNIPSSAKYGDNFTVSYNYSGNGVESVTTKTPLVCAVSGNTVVYESAGLCSLTASATATTEDAAANGSLQSFTISSMASAGSPTDGPTLVNIEAPYPPVQVPVTMAGKPTPYPPGSVAYGPPSTPLVLTGSNLGASGTVQFTPYHKCVSGDSNCILGAEIQGTAVPAQVTMWTSNMLFLTVPSDARSGLVTVTVDGGGTSNGLPFMVTLVPYLSSCPAFPPNTQLQITTASLHDGTAGQAYSATLNAQGGLKSYSWAITGLPNGLTWDSSSGTISGTPSSAAGPMDVTVQVTDSSYPIKQTDESVLSLTIGSQTGLTQAVVYDYCVPGPSNPDPNPNCASPNSGYDATGNITQHYDTVMGMWSFQTDTLNRLVSANATSGDFAGQNACWAYDQFGNRTSEAFSPTACANNPLLASWATYNTSNTNRMDTDSASTMYGANPSYDASGELKSDGGTSYLYDAEGRICIVQSTPIGGYTMVTEYLYNAEGQRVEKGTPTKCTSITNCSCDPSSNGFQMTENYVMGPGGEELTMLDGQGNWQRSNVYANGKLIATYDTIQDPTSTAPSSIPALHFQITDPLGTRRMQTDPVGQRETDCQSLPFGDFLNCFTDPNAPDTADDATPLHFTGKERDTESGNDYFEARYFGSSMGRFLSPDPMNMSAIFNYDDPQSWNGYSYARNNPLRFTDPHGETYQVCDSHGQNCSTLDDETFETDQAKDQANDEYFQNGTMFHMDDNGNKVTDGTYQQTSVDAPGLSGPANLAGAQFLYNQTRPAVNAMGAVMVSEVGVMGAVAAAPIASGIARWGLQRLAMAAENPELKEIVSRLYQASDKIPGGTAGAVENEVSTGEYISGGHAIKAAERITQLTRLINSGELSGSDSTIAGHILSSLQNALGR